MPPEPDDVSAVPWAMQLVAFVAKRCPAREVDTCEAAARAVVALLDDERSRTGSWADPVTRWQRGGIRKLVRRANGARWDAVQSLPGITVQQGDAAVRAFVPAPVRPLPPALRKLQVSGTQLPSGQPSTTRHARVTVGVSPLVQMTSGKTVAQCAHAAQLAFACMEELLRERWRADDFRVRVVHPQAGQWRVLTAPVSVVDAGYTELDGRFETARAWWA